MKCITKCSREVLTEGAGCQHIWRLQRPGSSWNWYAHLYQHTPAAWEWKEGREGETGRKGEKGGRLREEYHLTSHVSEVKY